MILDVTLTESWPKLSKNSVNQDYYTKFIEITT